MEYVSITFIPRTEGWYATLAIRDTTRVSRGRARTVGGPFGVLIEGTQPLETTQVAAALRSALEGLAAPPADL